jgi:hypothetical protein
MPQAEHASSLHLSDSLESSQNLDFSQCSLAHEPVCEGEQALDGHFLPCGCVQGGHDSAVRTLPNVLGIRVARACGWTVYRGCVNVRFKRMCACALVCVCVCVCARARAWHALAQ